MTLQPVCHFKEVKYNYKHQELPFFCDITDFNFIFLNLIQFQFKIVFKAHLRYVMFTCLFRYSCRILIRRKFIGCFTRMLYSCFFYVHLWLKFTHFALVETHGLGDVEIYVNATTVSWCLSKYVQCCSSRCCSPLCLLSTSSPNISAPVTYRETISSNCEFQIWG